MFTIFPSIDEEEKPKLACDPLIHGSAPGTSFRDTMAARGWTVQWQWTGTQRESSSCGLRIAKMAWEWSQGKPPKGNLDAPLPRHALQQLTSVATSTTSATQIVATTMHDQDQETPSWFWKPACEDARSACSLQGQATTSNQPCMGSSTIDANDPPLSTGDNERDRHSRNPTSPTPSSKQSIIHINDLTYAEVLNFEKELDSAVHQGRWDETLEICTTTMGVTAALPARQAFLMLSTKLHPDKTKETNRLAATTRFQLLLHMYEILNGHDKMGPKRSRATHPHNEKADVPSKRQRHVQKSKPSQDRR